MCLMVFGKVVFSLHICLLYIWTNFWLNLSNSGVGVLRLLVL